MREVEVTQEFKARNVDPVKYAGGADGQRGGTWTAATDEQTRKRVHTLGWRPTCEHVEGDAHGSWPIDSIPCTVLDPFSGSGTTALVARKHGRKCIGIELSADYCALSARRLQQLSLLAEGV